MDEHFTAGQNAPLSTRTVRFTATASVLLDLCAFVVDDRLQVTSSDDAVFYNQPATTGVRIDGDAIVVDVDAIRPGARVLCAVGCERPVPVATCLTVATGRTVATFHVEPGAGTETALLCWEIYRHRDTWKVRALGQGYAGGLVEMFTAHGVDVEAPPEISATDAAQVQGEEVPTPAVGLSPLEMLWRIFEDAARSTAAYTSSIEFARQRLDDELSAAVTDPARRTGPEAERVRGRAQRRYDALVEAAESRYRDDSAALAAELLTLDATLPPALASWTSPAWKRANTASDGVLIGELTADHEFLRIPFGLPAPLSRPLWVEGDPAELGPVVSSLVVRLLAARPGTLVHLVDPGRSLAELEALTAARFAGPPVHDRAQVPAKLRGLADALDLDVLAQQVDGGVPTSPVLVVLGGFPYGYDHEDLLQIVRITRSVGGGRISVVLAGDPPDDDDPVVRILRSDAQTLPVDGRLADPWTGGRWVFTPDRLPTETEHLRGVLDGNSLQD
ncbi:TerD family protein [Rhodococcus sp. NPDC047139]|uniref:TerD family protein n=1 Tax=Rhodococcus sp. NPDC047139 TaxID=3155141 RepID=UPI0033EE3B91